MTDPADLLPANELLAIVVIVFLVIWGIAWLFLPFLVWGSYNRLGELRDEMRQLNRVLRKPTSKNADNPADAEAARGGF